MASTFTPAGAPPAGVIPNLIDPSDTLYSAIVVTTSLIISVTTVFVVCRLVARMKTSRIALDDYLLIASWALNVGYNSVLIWQGKTGFGRHVWDVTVDDAVLIAKQSWALELIYCLVTWLCKASLLLQLQGIFAPLRTGAVFIAIQLLIWINLAFYVAIFFAVLFECVPQTMIWDVAITSGHCVDRNAEVLVAGVWNFVNDVFIFILPLWAIWHLHLDTKHKVGVSAVFLTGLIAVISSLGRVIYSFRATKTTDTTYIYAQISLWTLAEIASILLCICFPVLPLFYKVIFRRNNLLNNNSYGNSKPPNSRHRRKSRSGVASNGGGGGGIPPSSVSSYWRRDRCYSCRSGANCALHGNEKGDNANIIERWSDEEEAIGVARTTNSNNSANLGGIHRTISIEMTSRRETAQDLV